MKPGAMMRLRAAVGMLAAAAVATACTSTGGGAGPDGGTPNAEPGTTYTTGMIGVDDTGAEPVQGGTLTYGATTEPQVLDPAQAIVSGATGGLALAAVYDVLMRWDPASGQVVPQLADSLKPSEDHTVWTLKLRDVVTFSDGTPLDAEAVAWSLQRYVDNGGSNAELWRRNVEAVTTPDERTVVFELARTWPGFEFLLTMGPGMIVARSADAGETFTPVGAGAFTFVHHRLQEEILLEANEAYWEGRPHLDRIRAVFLGDQHTTVDSFNSGDVDAAFVSQPDLVEQVVAAGHSGFMSVVAMGSGGVAVINAAERHPGADPRVRKAMQLAINPEVMRKRTYDAGVASSAIYPAGSRWHTDVEPLGYDPEQSKRLLEQAKADGFDGAVSYTVDGAQQDTGLVIKSMLEAVGFTVELDLVRSVAELVRKVAADRDYDVAFWGLNWRGAGAYPKMFSTLHSEGNATVGMATSPEMDALISEFQTAPTEQARREVMGRIQAQWNEFLPALVWGPGAEFVVWSDRVHGIQGTTTSVVLVDDAWVTPVG